MPQVFAEAVSTPADVRADVFVAMYDAGLALVGSGYTDVAGRVFLGDQPAGTYSMRVHGPQPLTAHAGNTFSAVVPDQAAPVLFTVLVASPTLPQSADPGRCLCTGYFEDLDGSPSGDLTARITIHCGDSVRDVSSVLLGLNRAPVDVVADKDGRMSVSLLRGRTYSVALGTQLGSWYIHVPDAPSADLMSIIFPVVAGIVWFDGAAELSRAAPALALAVAEVKELTYKILLTSGVLLTDSRVYLSEDVPDVADLALEGTAVEFTGLAAGVVTYTPTLIPVELPEGFGFGGDLVSALVGAIEVTVA